MKRLIEKDRTYRIPKDDGTTELLQVLSVGDKLKVKDLQTGKVRTMSKSSFQSRLDKGEIYVSADLQRLRLILAKLVFGGDVFKLADHPKYRKEMEKRSRQEENKKVLERMKLHTKPKPSFDEDDEDEDDICKGCENPMDECTCCTICGEPDCDCCSNCGEEAFNCNCCDECGDTDRDECGCWCSDCGELVDGDCECEEEEEEIKKKKKKKIS